jgi:hypothetical protein
MTAAASIHSFLTIISHSMNNKSSSILLLQVHLAKTSY